MKIKGGNVLVTGGAGFIGSHLCERLITKGAAKIIIVDNLECGRKKNLSSALKDKRVNFLKADIRNSKFLDKVIKEVDIIFHLAALRHLQCTKEPRYGHEVLVDGTFNVFESAAKHNIRKVVFASSASVYGDPKRIPMRENDSYNDKTLYGAGKIYNERLAIAFYEIYKLPFVGLRNFNVYGPRMDIKGVYTQVLIRWLDKISKSERPIVHGTGRQSLDFIYVDDVVDANILAAESRVTNGFFNVGSGKETTLIELLELLLKLTDSELKPVYKSDRIHGLANRRKASTIKAQKILGFRAKTSLKDGLLRLIEWYKNEKAKVS